MRARMEQEMAQKEMEILEYWLAELKKLHQKKHLDLAALGLELGGLTRKMETRISVLRQNR